MTPKLVDHLLHAVKAILRIRLEGFGEDRLDVAANRCNETAGRGIAICGELLQRLAWQRFQDSCKRGSGLAFCIVRRTVDCDRLGLLAGENNFCNQPHRVDIAGNGEALAGALLRAGVQLSVSSAPWLVD